MNLVRRLFHLKCPFALLLVSEITGHKNMNCSRPSFFYSSTLLKKRPLPTKKETYKTLKFCTLIKLVYLF